LKFVLFVEGATEHKALAGFLKKWLDSRLKQPVGIRLVDLAGWSKFRTRIQRKIVAELEVPGREDVIAAIGLLDLYGPNFYPDHTHSPKERCEWAVNQIEREVGNKRFKMFFAVHETEAWLLSQPEIFPSGVRDQIEKHKAKPEAVNFNKPPATHIKEAYHAINRTYKKTIDGYELFSRADPEFAYESCPYLKRMLDTMLDLAKNAEP